jgi:hypothetical protein
MEEQSQDVPLLAPIQINPSDTEETVMSVISATVDNKKVRYLGYRASGFSVREALQLCDGMHEKTLSRWRANDPVFAEQERNLPELRKTLSAEFVHLEFMRNYRLILQNDYNIVQKSLDTPHEMTNADLQYLLKMRSHYTPQALQILQELIGASSKSESFNFTNFIMSLSREQNGQKQEITIKGTKGG